jgi:putative nucleotidyltransferase with HDIG domain
VTRIVVHLARELGWHGADLEMLEFAALLHDVGKIAVPDDILRKPEELVPDEWNVIYLHPYHSAQILRPVEPLRKIIPWIYHHHERWDGEGYPDRLKGEAIPEGARIIAVVDAFNAITTNRPYHKALSEKEALDEIERNAGKQFDPVVVEAFMKVMKAMN